MLCAARNYELDADQSVISDDLPLVSTAQSLVGHETQFRKRALAALFSRRRAHS